MVELGKIVHSWYRSLRNCTLHRMHDFIANVSLSLVFTNSAPCKLMNIDWHDIVWTLSGEHKVWTFRDTVCKTGVVSALWAGARAKGNVMAERRGHFSWRRTCTVSKQRGENTKSYDYFIMSTIVHNMVLICKTRLHWINRVAWTCIFPYTVSRTQMKSSKRIHARTKEATASETLLNKIFKNSAYCF